MVADNKPDSMSSKDLLEIQTTAYLPPPNHRGTMNDMGLPMFTLRQVELMRRDEQVKLGERILKAPLMHIKFEVSGRPDVAAFAQQQMLRAWDSVIPKLTTAMWYKVCCGEPIYRKNQTTKQMEIAGLNDFHPSDCDFLEIDKKLVGIRVTDRGSVASEPHDLYGMKAFHYIHRQQFGSRDGVSELEGAYRPWLTKTGRDGALACLTLWNYKNAFNSGMMFHPPGEYQWTDGNGMTQIMPYRDIARQAMERNKTGNVMAFPSVFDEKGNLLWRYEQPKINGDGSGLIQYVEQLNTEMLRGMGIPDDIISQTSGTGSYAGRSIPFQAFLTSQNDTVKAMFQAVEKQIVAHLCWWNFQSRDFEFHGVEVDRAKLLPIDQPEAPPGATPPDMSGGGEDPNAAMADPQQAAMLAAAQQQQMAGAAPPA